jgi:F0F1-type ATP synthase membrane subunit c/vacuolar-type H+-ATPase subunit K
VPVLAFVAGVLVGLWGIAHAIPTRKVVAGFGPISRDNRRILIQEWLAEALTMWGLAALVIVTTAVAAQSTVAAWVYRLVAGLLIGLGILTGLTGARTPVIWFKICVALLVVSTAMLLVSSVT